MSQPHSPTLLKYLLADPWIEKVGALLAERSLCLKEIARRVGATEHSVKQIQRRLFPDLKPPDGRGRHSQPHSAKFDEVIALLPDCSLTLREIGKRVGLSGERVRQIQAKHLPDLNRIDERKQAKPKPPWISPTGFVQLIQRWLNEIDAHWCYKCRTVQNACEGFSPGSRFRNGLVCRACNAARARLRYKTNPKQREYCRQYNRTQKAREYQRKWSREHPGKRGEYNRRSLAKRPINVHTDTIFHKATVTGFIYAAERYLTPEQRAQLKEQL